MVRDSLCWILVGFSVCWSLRMPRQAMCCRSWQAHLRFAGTFIHCCSCRPMFVCLQETCGNVRSATCCCP